MIDTLNYDSECMNAYNSIDIIDMTQDIERLPSFKYGWNQWKYFLADDDSVDNLMELIDDPNIEFPAYFSTTFVTDIPAVNDVIKIKIGGTINNNGKIDYDTYTVTGLTPHIESISYMDGYRSVIAHLIDSATVAIQNKLKKIFKSRLILNI